jgi:hypothetical protein
MAVPYGPNRSGGGIRGRSAAQWRSHQYWLATPLTGRPATANIFVQLPDWRFQVVKAVFPADPPYPVRSRGREPVQGMRQRRASMAMASVVSRRSAVTFSITHSPPRMVPTHTDDLSFGDPARGEPLPPDLRSRLEGAFCVDLQHIRVHLGPQARRRGVGAFAHGTDLYFAPENFRPDDSIGASLVVHELVHVFQQASPASRGPIYGAPSMLIDETDEGPRAPEPSSSLRGPPAGIVCSRMSTSKWVAATSS